MTTGYYKKEKNWFERNPKKTILAAEIISKSLVEKYYAVNE